MGYSISSMIIILFSWINTIIAYYRVNAERIVIGKTSIDRLLTTNTDQEINGNVSVHGSVIMNGFAIDINHLKTENPIFGVDLSKLLHDSYHEVENSSIVVTTEKRFENVTIGQLIVESDLWHIGKTTEEIEKSLDQLTNGISIEGPETFTSQFRIKNLTVIGLINDIPSSYFGQNWLLFEGKQVRSHGKFCIIHIHFDCYEFKKIGCCCFFRHF